jgi:hypothetical protein
MSTTTERRERGDVVGRAAQHRLDLRQLASEHAGDRVEV